jgi:hypothetical protein
VSAPAWQLPRTDTNRPTLLSHALALTALHGPGPWPGGGEPLPDAPAEPAVLSPVVLDGIRTHHFAFTPDDGTATSVVDLIGELVTRPPTAAGLDLLHDLTAGAGALEIADAVGAELSRRDLPAGRVRAVARWLAEHGTHRGAVATGIVLLGAAGDERDRDLLLLLGALETLSLYAVVALGRSQQDRERAVYDLARRLDGWGRIHAVERLRGCQDAEIRGWLLRDGFRNTVMNEYLACLAARTGDLLGALTAPVVDDALLDGAGGILAALGMTGGPAEDIRAYPDGPAAIERYLDLVADRPPTLRRVTDVLTLQRCTADDDEPALSAWSAAARAGARQACQRLLARPRWRAVVTRSLDADDLDVFRRALWPAMWLGIPIRDRVHRRLETDPLDLPLWMCLTGDPGDVGDPDGVTALAERLLPLDVLATGPGMDPGLGPDRAADRVLEFVVGGLHRVPGTGWPLIRTALANRVVRTRAAAVRALSAWPGPWPDGADAAVRQALAAEPDRWVRRSLRHLEPGA